MCFFLIKYILKNDSVNGLHIRFIYCCCCCCWGCFNFCSSSWISRSFSFSKRVNILPNCSLVTFTFSCSIRSNTFFKIWKFFISDTLVNWNNSNHFALIYIFFNFLKCFEILVEFQLFKFSDPTKRKNRLKFHFYCIALSNINTQTPHAKIKRIN